MHDGELAATMAEAKDSAPRLGIFWVARGRSGGARLIAAGCALEHGERYGNCLTYGPGHYETWRKWRRERAIDSELRVIVRTSEYEDWPRGRIIFDRARDRFVLYADRRLMGAETIVRIRERFGLPVERTLVEADSHYRSSETPPEPA
jgi:hypothetical protein